MAACFAAAQEASQTPRVNGRPIDLTAISLEASSIRPNLIPNCGFEEVEPNGIPVGWQWDRRNTDATCVIDTEKVHNGHRSIRITNGTSYGAHIYGMLWRTSSIRLDVGKPYTLSTWIMSDAPGHVGLMGGGAWQFRVYVPATGGQWQRIWTTFTPGEKDRDFVVRLSTESPTRGVWIDDLKLEEGREPTLVQPADDGAWLLEAGRPETEIQGDGPFVLGYNLWAPRALAVTGTVALSSGELLRQPLQIAAGAWRVAVQGESLAADDAPRAVTFRLERNGKELARAQTQLRFFSASNACQRLAVLKGGLPRLEADLAAVKARGQDIAYPLVTFTVLENFVGYAGEDARRGEVKRALAQVGDLERMAARLQQELSEARAGRRQFAAVPRWSADVRPVIRGSSFLAPRSLPGGTPTKGPVFFNGFGHFGQVVADLEKWPAYGANIIQIEFGPSSLFPQEGRTNSAPVRQMLQTLDRAQKAGVAVCLLISPHYFPGWALDKWPHLRKRREGFLQYCLHAPEGQELLRRFLAAAIGPLKDHPALHSICLSNEPVNEEEPCEFAAREWDAWLEKRHNNVVRLNGLCGSNFTSFAAVPLPNPFGPRPAPALWMDFIRFNQEFFASWHQMLADAVHAVAPDLPVHAKAMTWTLLNDSDVRYGVDATLFGRFSGLNGNDAVNFYSFGSGEFAQGWQMNAMGHDLQLSVLDAPLINTENHLIADRETRSVPAEHIRAALWQAAVHGQSATTIWVWERTYDPKSDFAGSIMHRPACAEAVGIVNHDLNRAAVEISALQQSKPQVLLLQSVTASVWDFGRYSDCLGKLYTALSFTGLKIGFVTERQLEAGLIPSAPLVFVPGIQHLSDAAFAALQKYKGRLVMVGDGGLLTHNEYGQARPATMPADRITCRYGPTQWRDLWKEVRVKLPAWGQRPAVELRAPDGQPVWGVEWRSAESVGGLLVNLCNYRPEPVACGVFRNNRLVQGKDVLSGETLDQTLTLKPLEVRLVRVE